MSFLLAQMKELKKTSTPSKASPYMGRMQTENCRNRQFSVGFGKPGHGLGFYFFYLRIRRLNELAGPVCGKMLKGGGIARDMELKL